MTNTRRNRSQRAAARQAARDDANDAFTAAFATAAPNPPANPPALARMAAVEGMQVDDVLPQQPLPPNYQNNCAVEEALAAAAAPPEAAGQHPPQAQAGADPPHHQQQPPRQRQRRSNQQHPRQQRRVRAPRHVQTAADRYEPCLRSLMDWKLQRVHMKNHTFTREQLLSISDRDIYRWMKHRIYGDEEAAEASAPPLYYRHNSVLFWKKAISHYMPNSHMPWNVETKTGNPTRSPLILKLLKNIKRFEVQRRGKEPKWKRPFTPEEFEQIQQLSYALENKEDALCLAAYWALQFSMMARLDGTGKFRQPDLKAYTKYPLWGIICRLPWAKNVYEERDAPPQVIFGAMNPHYDVLSTLGLWLEWRFEYLPEDIEFIFCVDAEDDPERIKDHVSDILRDMIKSNDFIIREVGRLGTHSTRKYSVTFARGNGCGKVRNLVPLIEFSIMLTHLFLFRMIVIPEVDGRTPDVSTRRMLIHLFPLWMLRLLQHCAKAGRLHMWWMRSRALLIVGF
jgi:hypothetical protein